MEKTTVKLFEWFSDNQMKGDPDKCHFMTSGSKDLVITVENSQITNSKCKKLLGIKTDHKLTFNTHIYEIFENVGLRMNAFFILQFNYCPLTWTVIVQKITK